MKQTANHVTRSVDTGWPTQTINSRWVVEKGIWDRATHTFIDRTTEEFERIITMTIENRNGREILQFHGGPTGFESYYIGDLLAVGPIADRLCICAGTINRWPMCSVDAVEVFEFIKSNSLAKIRHAS